MRLLFDQNLSRHLVRRLADLYPASQHVLLLQLEQVSDVEVWQYARDHSYMIATKDADFSELSTVFGTPPKVVWIRRGNCTTEAIEALLRQHVSQIAALHDDPRLDFLAIE